MGHRKQSWLSLIPTSPNPAHTHWPHCGPDSPVPPMTTSSLGQSVARPWGPHQGYRGGKDWLAVPGGRCGGDRTRGALRLFLHPACFWVYYWTPPTLGKSAGCTQASPSPSAGRQAGSLGFPRRPHPPLHVGRAVPTPPLTCAAAADRASLKSPSGISFAGPQSLNPRWGYGGEGSRGPACPGNRRPGWASPFGLGIPLAQRGCSRRPSPSVPVVGTCPGRWPGVHPPLPAQGRPARDPRARPPETPRPRARQSLRRRAHSAAPPGPDAPARSTDNSRLRPPASRNKSGSSREGRRPALRRWSRDQVPSNLSEFGRHWAGWGGAGRRWGSSGRSGLGSEASVAGARAPRTRSPRGRTWRRSRRAANRAGPRPGGAGRGPVGGAGQGGALQPGRGEGCGAVSPATGPGSSSLPAPHFPARVIFFLPRDEPSPSSRAQDPVWLWTECKATLNGTTAHPGCDSVSPCCEMGADKTVVTTMAVLQRSLRSRSRPTAHP